MKKLFFIGIIGIIAFEILKVYFIMPMPGSQRMNSIDVAYFLHSYRWLFRALFGGLILAGVMPVFQGKRKWIPAVCVVIALAVIYLFNFKMMADQMFKQPENLVFKGKAENVLGDSTIVLGVEYNGEAKAYPLRFIVYHHQVQDVIGGKPMIITYCSVCRTGRVFEPSVKGQPEKFRLVGMDHFNAMFEDETTGSWWRQVNGEAIAGPLEGESLPEVECHQVTLAKLFELYPHAVVMQEDEASLENYDSLGRYERGKSKGDLTRTDSLSWNEKSWVVGIVVGQESKAYDWNQLKTERLIQDELGGKAIAVAIASDNASFVAFERDSDTTQFSIRNDSLLVNGQAYDFVGRSHSNPTQRLKTIKAYQEFWHSWRTFHPQTKKYDGTK